MPSPEAQPAAKATSPARVPRRQLRVSRCARALEPYKTIAEFAALVLGLGFGTLFLVRTWSYPNAALSLHVVERVARDAHEVVVIEGALTVGDAANLDISKVTTRCRVMDHSGRCVGECGDVEQQLTNGRLPRGDSRGWACRYEVPVDGCIELTQEIRGQAAFFAWQDSHWVASAISCGRR